MSCSHPVVDGRVCEFYVQSEMCDNIAENISNVATLTLKGKYSYIQLHFLSVKNLLCIAPQVRDVNIIPQYFRKNYMTENLTSIRVSFPADSVS